MNYEHPNVGPRLSAKYVATKRQLDWTTAEALEVASSETKRTIRLLQDLLSLARAYSYLYCVWNPLLNDLVVEVVGMVEQSARAIAIEGTFPIKVRADRNSNRFWLTSLTML